MSERESQASPEEPGYDWQAILPTKAVLPRFHEMLHRSREWTNNEFSGIFKEFVEARELRTPAQVYEYIRDHLNDPALGAELDRLTILDRQFIHHIVTRTANNLSGEQRSALDAILLA